MQFTYCLIVSVQTMARIQRMIACLRVLGLSFFFNKVLICAVCQTAEN